MNTSKMKNKKTLLEKAKQVKVANRNRQKKFSTDEINLFIALFNDDISFMQAVNVLKLGKTNFSSVYIMAYMALKQHLKNKNIKLK